jgi:predicted NBD/HSP70 family sugar kinase
VSELVRRATAGEPQAVAALEDAARWLGIALGTVVNLISPQAIVLGGHFAPMSEWLAPVISSELSTRVLGGNGAVPPVLSSSLGAEAAMRGAAATQLRRLLADPTLVAGALPT